MTETVTVEWPRQETPGGPRLEIMQDCCRVAPRRARYLVIAIVVLAAIALAVMERS